MSRCFCLNIYAVPREGRVLSNDEMRKRFYDSSATKMVHERWEELEGAEIEKLVISFPKDGFLFIFSDVEDALQDCPFARVIERFDGCVHKKSVQS